MRYWRNLNNWIETHIWTFSLILTLIASPLILWGSWDTIGSVHSAALRVLLSLGIVAITYVGLGLLLLWNRWAQRKHRGAGIVDLLI